MAQSEIRAGAQHVLLPVTAVIGATAAFQVGAAIAKGLFPAIGPQGAAALRITLGALMLVVVLRPWRGWPARAPLLPMLGLGLSTGGAILFFYLALGRLPQGVAIALQFLGPLAVAIAGSHRPRDLVWAALAAAGVWALLGRDLAPARASSTCWASATPSPRPPAGPPISSGARPRAAPSGAPRRRWPPPSPPW